LAPRYYCREVNGGQNFPILLNLPSTIIVKVGKEREARAGWFGSLLFLTVFRPPVHLPESREDYKEAEVIDMGSWCLQIVISGP